MPAKPLTSNYNQTVTGAGFVLGVNSGKRQENGAAPRQEYPEPYEFVATAVGGTATVAIQTSPDNVTWTTVGGAVSLTSGQTMKSVGRLTTQFLRANVTAIAGATVNSYFKFF